MDSKKTELIGVKISKPLKAELQRIANEKEWTLSHLAEKILRDYVINHQNNSKSRFLFNLKTPIRRYFFA